MRRFLLTLLPKIALSRLTGLLTRIPLPRSLRGWVFARFAKRYGVALREVDRPLVEFRSLAEFFARPLAEGSREVAAHSSLVWPCDGRVVTGGELARDDREATCIPQVKGVDYRLDEFLACSPADAARYEGGSQITIYLAPGDYHRVHAPFAGRLVESRSVDGTLFPVNPPAVDAIHGLFVRNARRVFEFELDDGRRGAVVMVGALNVGDIQPTAAVGDQLAIGAELGRFGFGSTTVVVLERGNPSFPALQRECRVLQGGAPPDSGRP